MKTFALLISAAAVALPQAALARQRTAPPSAELAAVQPRTVVELRDGWRFRFGEADGADKAAFDDRSWSAVAVPHTWNKVGIYEPATGIAQSQTPDKSMGIGWYRLRFGTPARRSGARVWLEFDAASRTAEVWLNGVRLGKHEGGFSRFRFDATPALAQKGDNVLSVKVDNSQPKLGGPTADNLPLLGDFFVYGGLYRPVRMVVTEGAQIDMLDLGGPGVYAHTVDASPERAQVAVRTKLRNLTGRDLKGIVRVSLVDAEGRTAASSDTPLTVRNGAAAEAAGRLTVNAPRLWQGVADPYLYRLVAELRTSKGAVLDRTEQEFGIRTIRIDPARGLFLNGKHLPLHGVGLHQDRQPAGWAQSEADVAATVATLRDMGANTIRLTHYQHGQPIHELANRAGLILWDEIGLVTSWTVDPQRDTATDAFMRNAREQLQEMIRQNYNHPSVAVWGIANEVDFGPSRPDFLGNPPAKLADPRPLLQSLNSLAKNEDPLRPTTLATCCEERGINDVPVVADITDTAGVNRYFGWYYGTPDQIGAHLDALHAKRPAQPLAVAEYGAGGAFSLQSDDPRGGPIDPGGRTQPEAAQTWIHEQTWPQLKARPYLWATWLWNGFDFSSTVRREGDSVDINTKGLVSYDGKIRKDAFYFYRANWSSQPTVHITGRRYVDRAYGVTDIRVYSNAPATRLSVNGVTLGSKTDCPDRICVWPAVRLNEGDNTVLAEGDFAGAKRADTVLWTLASGALDAFRIDSGALVAAEAGGVRYGSDAFFTGGKWGSADKRPRGRPAVLAHIAGTPDRDVYATYREGDFAYRIPVRNGRYEVTLQFVEPSAAAGERVFDVKANGKVRLRAFDIAQAAGKPLTAVTRTFAADVSNGLLELQFTPIKGQAIVSGLTVQPVSSRAR